jgi:hypothetical protein
VFGSDAAHAAHDSFQLDDHTPEQLAVPDPVEFNVAGHDSPLELNAGHAIPLPDLFF